jgi:hypothetical protein
MCVRDPRKRFYKLLKVELRDRAETALVVSSSSRCGRLLIFLRRVGYKRSRQLAQGRLQTVDAINTARDQIYGARCGFNPN